VHGNFSDDPTSEFRLFDLEVKSEDANTSTARKGKPSKVGIKDNGAKGGYVELDNDLTLNGLMDLDEDGEVLLHGRFSTETTASLIIDGGTFVSDAPYEISKGWENLWGNFHLSDGLFELTHNSPRFPASATTSVSGGIIRSGTGFMAEDEPAVFNASGGTVEILVNSTATGVIYCGGDNSFYNFRVNSLDGNSAVLSTDITVANNLTIDAGTLEISVGFYFSLSGVGLVSVMGPVLIISDCSCHYYNFRYIFICFSIPMC